MGRSRCCAICADPVATPAINALIEAGVRQRVIHEQNSQFSVSKISRQYRFCLQPKPVASGLPADAGSDEIRVWLGRASEMYLLSASQGDSKGATAAISAATRALVNLHKRQEKEAAAERASSPDPNKLTIANLDQMVEQFAEADKHVTVCRFCGAPRELQGKPLEEPQNVIAN